MEQFERFYAQAKVQILNRDETKTWKKATIVLMQCALSCATVIVTTPMQVANGSLQGVIPDAVIFDEATTATEPDILAGWIDRAGKED